jgi:hypothetical protein
MKKKQIGRSFHDIVDHYKILDLANGLEQTRYPHLP